MLFYRKVTFRSDMSNFDNAEINIDLKFLDGMNIAKQMTEFQTKKSHPKVANRCYYSESSNFLPNATSNILIVESLSAFLESLSQTFMQAEVKASALDRSLAGIPSSSH